MKKTEMKNFKIKTPYYANIASMGLNVAFYLLLFQNKIQ